jgi:hypothetical protein
MTGGLPARPSEFHWASSRVVGQGLGSLSGPAYPVCADSDLTGANLSDTDLTGANLERADVRGAILSGAELRDANLSEILYDSTTIWPGGFQPPPSRPRPVTERR